MKWIKTGLWALMALLLLAMAAVGVYIWRALPAHDGQWTVQGLRGEVRIERDSHGIPTIRAGNREDLAFGLGVAHAQDRLWQLETHRRIGAGRLAEVFGEPALAGDRFLRALGVRRAAAAQWQQVSPESRALLQAYARGVNHVLAERQGARPPEFLVLGLQPEPWDPVDSMAWAIMMAWDLGANWNNELLRLRLALKMPLERIQQAMPPYPGDAPPRTADYPELYRSLKLDGATVQAWSALPDIAPPSGIEGVGSNNWVVSGRRTQTGKPMLANDPHLGLTTPALWYFARLEAPGLKVAGATLPGLPMVVLGQSEHAAWGFTNTGPDVQDLYLEQLEAGGSGRYRTPQGWAAFETGQEVIKVKGQPDVPITWRRTRHGPVISDAGMADDVLGPKGRPTHVLAMRWTALDPDSDPVAVALGFERARTVHDFIAAAQGWVAPMQSMVVADREGRIAMVAPGRVPRRKPGHDLQGLAPAPGWDERYDWDGFVPAGETPREIDPERGYIATANQRIVPPDYPHFLTHEWTLPYRQQRIEQLLEAKPRHTLEDLAAIHADRRSLAAARVLPWLAKARSGHPLGPQVQALLAGFDGTMDADKPAPLVYWAWKAQLTQAIFADDFTPALWERSLVGNRNFFDALDGVLSRNDAGWCDDRTTPAKETCEELNDRALTRAIEELQARFGRDPAQWRWGQAHQARSEHRPFSKVGALARWFELRSPVGGDSYTVNVSRVTVRPDPTTGERYLSGHGPSLRALYDLEDPKRSRVMHSTGQSGLVFSPQYRSFVQPWTDVAYVPLWPEGPPARTLRLLPP